MKALVFITLLVPGVLALNACSKIEEPPPPLPRLSSSSTWPPPAPSHEFLASPGPGVPSSAASSSAPDAFGVYRVGGDVQHPVEISRVAPVIPERYRHVRITQPLYIYEAVITVDGTVSNLRLLRGPTNEEPYISFEKAFHTAFAQWRYRPATLNGRPVPVHLTLTGTLEVR